MMKRANPAKAGLWSIDGDTLVRMAGWEVGPAIVAVPSEAAPAIIVDLPGSRAERRAALPPAVARRTAAPLETVHVAVGGEVAPHAFVAAVVDHAVMRRWTAAIDAAGFGHAAVVPDALLLPIPPTGAWTVAAGAGRVRVRTDDGGGFAVTDANFAAAWVQGGSFVCEIVGEDPPAGLPAKMMRPAAASRPGRVALDLRQGAHAAPGQAIARTRRLGLILAGGLLAHTAIAAADTVKLRALAADQRRAHATGPRFLPLMTRTAGVLARTGDARLAGLRFAGAVLTLRVAGAPGALRHALGAAGLGSVVVEGEAS